MANFIPPAFQAIMCTAIVFSFAATGVAEMTPGKIQAIQVAGEVLQRTSTGRDSSALRKDAILAQGAVIETGSSGSVTLLFANGSVITLGPDTEFSVEKFLTDPFNVEEVDYRALRQEPARSETRLKQEKGSLVFSVRKQKAGSSYDIVTPVGTAGIRGTLGAIWIDDGSTPENPSGGLGVDNGLVAWTLPDGQSQDFGPGSATGLGGQGGNFQFQPPPQNTGQMMNMARETGEQQQQQIPPAPFTPSTADAPAGQPTSAEISPENQEKLAEAAAAGNQTLLDTVMELIGQVGNEEASAMISYAAGSLGDDPALVPQLSNLGTEVVQWMVEPGDTVETGQVLAIISVGGVEMEYRATADGILLRQSVAENQLSDSEAIALITADASELLPAMVAAASRLNPGAAAAMAAAAASSSPQMAQRIALGTSIAAPGKAQEIAQQILNAVPGLSQSAVLTSALAGSGISPEEISMTVELLMGSFERTEQETLQNATQAMSGGGPTDGNAFPGAGALDTPGNPGGVSNPFTPTSPTPAASPTPIEFPSPPTPYSS